MPPFVSPSGNGDQLQLQSAHALRLADRHAAYDGFENRPIDRVLDFYEAVAVCGYEFTGMSILSICLSRQNLPGVEPSASHTPSSVSLPC